MSVWDDLIGQEALVSRLATAVDEAAAVLAGTVLAGTGKAGAGMTHAWLFTGIPGSGRSTAARAFAAALQCPRMPPGCGDCLSCHQVRQGAHADIEVVRPAGLSYGSHEARKLVRQAATSPTGRRWRIVLFEEADRATEHAANALLKAIEEAPPRTVWLLCAPTPHDLMMTLRSRCRPATLRTPPAAAIADALVQRDGTDRELAIKAARASQGDIRRARQMTIDQEARNRRDEVLALPCLLTGVGPAVTAAATLMAAATADARATTEELDAIETADLRRALGENGEGRMPPGTAGALRELKERQRSRAIRIRRDSLHRALLDMASYYRDVLVLQFGSTTELVNPDRIAELLTAASSGTPEETLRRLDAIMECRNRIDANVTPLLAVEAMSLALRTL
ncbi:DNA polymerase III subunit delta' [Actinomadura sp. 9N407]|uniref:DNA polymerase III subunit delta' n=1 Tax=Actinomadura sp. 9N407 TaxID=3375154 RepID=UPI003788A8E3